MTDSLYRRAKTRLSYYMFALIVVCCVSLAMAAVILFVGVVAVIVTVRRVIRKLGYKDNNKQQVPQSD